jgi:hypothetical protein
MEQVYIVGIVAVALVMVIAIALLRRRITHAKGTLSLKKKVIAGELVATPPDADSAAERPKLYAPTPSGVRENVQIGSPIVRVLRGVRIFRNLQIGRGRIEVTNQVDSGKKTPPA